MCHSSLLIALVVGSLCCSGMHMVVWIAASVCSVILPILSTIPDLQVLENAEINELAENVQHGTDGSIEETLCVKLKAKKQPQMQFFMHILKREMSHSNNKSFQEASQNASINVPHEKLKVTLLFTP